MNARDEAQAIDRWNAHNMRAYPHEGACAGCREQRRCNVCGDKIERLQGCTNGRCIFCHNDCCAPGGATSPGHGFGDALNSRRLRVKNTPAGTLP